MGPKKESLINLGNQTEKTMNISTQTNENIKNFKKAIADTNDQPKETIENLIQLYTTANKALQLAEENQQKFSVNWRKKKFWTTLKTKF